jgi:asparagine synthase (glutamine-hydrolysing)
MVADVPVGIFLSGGIDSSALVAAARAGGTGALRTFTVTFDANEYSEAPFAREVAEAFDTEHHVLSLSGAAVRDDLPAIVARLDQPSIDGINSYYVARTVAATGTKAVLSGTGGDEMFGGYPSFRRVPRARRARARSGGLFAAAAPMVGAALPPRLAARWHHFQSSNGSLGEAYRAQRGFFMPAEWRGLLGPALADRLRPAAETLSAVEAELLAPAGRECDEAGLARLETNVYLGSQLLRDLDAMSMAHALEVRVPYVDHELLASIWPALGSHPWLLSNKRLLHETLALPLPPAVPRRRKQGFVLPFEMWLRSDLREFLNDGLDAAAEDGWILPQGCAAIRDEWLQGRAHWTRPFGLAVLGAFLRSSTAWESAGVPVSVAG